MGEILAPHPLGREALLEAGPYTASIELAEPSDGVDRLRLPLDDEPGDALVDHLRHRAGSKRDDRRTAGHRLDHDQAERLGPIDGEQQGCGTRQKLLLGLVVDLADQLDFLAVDLWLEALLEVALLAARQFR